MPLELKDGLSQSAELVVLASHEVALGVKLRFKVLNCDLEHIFVGFHLHELGLKVLYLGLGFD